MRVRKQFKEDKLYYSGEVTGIDTQKGSGKPLYHVHYDDGDDEDLFYEELIPWLTNSATGEAKP